MQLSKNNLHVCLVCDGYEMTDKQAGLFVGSEASIETAFALSWFTPKITVFTHGLFEVSESMSSRLKELGYRLVETPIKQFLIDWDMGKHFGSFAEIEAEVDFSGAFIQAQQEILQVMGRRGLSCLQEIFLGSVSNYILHHAPCSVLIVHGE